MQKPHDEERQEALEPVIEAENLSGDGNIQPCLVSQDVIPQYGSYRLGLHVPLEIERGAKNRSIDAKQAIKLLQFRF
ncbi:MAG TPA: hypothetical protein V6D00_05165 [Pantanalinema sp.]